MSTLKEGSLQVVNNYLTAELTKYSKEPLNQLVALLMCGARFPPNLAKDLLSSQSLSKASICANELFVSFVWPRFRLQDKQTQKVDRESLNLGVLLMGDRDRYDPLRKLIQDTGHIVNKDVFVTTCINALRCFVDLRR